MNEPRLSPCLWFRTEADAAAQFYTSTLGGSILRRSYYPDAENVGGYAPGDLLTVDFSIGGLEFTALNGGPEFRPNPSVSFMVEVEDADAVDRIAARLLDGGEALMPVDTYPWSTRYGWVQDRFGISWQLMATGQPRTTIMPTLLFSGDSAGRASEALEHYSQIFDTTAENVSRYGPEEGEREGWIGHASLALLGARLAVTDGDTGHGHPFSEAISLQVLCDTQEQIDRYWDALTAKGGRESQCGWLVDRFGVSWQVSPAVMAGWLASDDGAGRARAFRAMMQMRKLDLPSLEAAYRGE
ncbi:VOC family protein [Salinibacterium sp. dk2585]|uniref:VOC family protein n=1 Tax=unclassified Salinibacterium TaxID=2632331 RepID=UPI0011C25254|nr:MULTISPECIES: VOC family protein [unclassified Salinibacterium]QEE62222.1 VOC family protein [Salinibacterium sp. dk2585]TXK53574.1 VOC family protein [Salinibacterium sp. dk5596]